MTYKNFMVQYKAAKDKEEFVKKHIKKQYLPYVEKLSIARTIANATSWDEEKNYKRDSVLQAWLLQVHMVTDYTDLTCDDKDVSAMYDTLAENGILEIIFSSIPESERVQLQAMTDMAASDIYTNFRDVTAWLDNKIATLDTTLGTIVSGLQEAIINEKKDNIIAMPEGNSET